MTRSEPSGQARPRPLPKPPPLRAAPRPPGVPAPGHADHRTRATGQPTLDWEKLFAARLYAARVRPFLATALFALDPVESLRVATMAVDRYWRCYVSPAYVARLPLEALASVWVHEVSHLLREHHARGDRLAAARGTAEPADRLRFNLAADCEINDDTYDEELSTPPGAVLPALLGLHSGRLMEEYVPQISLGSMSQAWTWLDCGSGADGLDRPWDLGPDGAHGLSPHERAAVRFRVTQAINAAPGDVPAGWRRWAEEAHQPPLPWTELLGAAIRAAAGGTAGAEDYSYTRPSRRATALPGLVLPGMRREPPRVAVLVDTSGSVTDAELGAALREVTAIVGAIGDRRDRVSVVSCDAAAQRVDELCRSEQVTLMGGGGTDLRAGFARALSASPRPDTVVALTDGHTPWPAAAPPCRTVVGLFPGRHGAEPPPGWARVVRIAPG